VSGLRAWRAAGSDLDIADVAAAYAYPAEGPWLRANMVCSADGAAAAENGVTRGISSDADRDLLLLLRALSDVVLVGAGTVRAEGYGPVRIRPEHESLRAAAHQPPVPPLAVVSGRLDLDLARPMFTEAKVPTIVLTSAQAPPERLAAARAVADVVVAGEAAVDPGAARRALVERGHRRILCEGGPALLAQLAGAGLLDELCLTVSPVLTGGDAFRILRGGGLPGGQNLTLGHVLTAGDELYLRYLVRG
jgi:riboflavin biosynthesis pyrimidine reductase